MAFTSEKHAYTRSAVLTFAESTLFAYLDGKEKAYAVRDVLREVRATYHGGGDQAISLIEQAMQSPDDRERLALVTKALDLLGRQSRSDGVTATL